ncbi:MAG: lipopolysaccharide biosynthesis protein [Gemmatimonadota bacterium]
MRDLRAAALRGTVWSAIQQLGDRGLRVPVYLILARLLSPQAFGLIALASAYVDFLQLFRNQGISAALVQRERLLPEHLDSAFWGGIVQGLAMGALAFVTAGLFASMARQPELELIVRWMSVAFVLSALSSVQDSILRRELRFRALAVRSVIGQAVAGVVAITAALRGLGVWSLVLMLLVYQGANVLLLWRASRWRPRWRFSWKLYRELLAFGVGMLGLSLVRFARARADNFLIGVGLGAAALGYYSIAHQVVGGLGALVTGSVWPVLWSTLTRLQRERDRLARAIRQATEMLGLATWPIYVGLAAVAPFAVPAILGDRWIPSVPVLAAVSLGAIAFHLVTSPLTAIVALGRTGWRVWAEVITAVGTLGAILIALPWGIEAVAWAYAIALFLTVPLQLAIALRFLELDAATYLTAFRTPAIGSLLMLGVVMGARIAIGERLAPLPALAVHAGLGAIVYVAYVRFAAPDLVGRAVENVRAALRTSLLERSEG